MVVNHYEVLGVARDATTDDIKKAYRRAARKYHPDASESPDPAKFTAATEAHEVLTDPERRRGYDASLSGGQADSQPRAPYTGSSRTSRRPGREPGRGAPRRQGPVMPSPVDILSRVSWRRRAEGVDDPEVKKGGPDTARVIVARVTYLVGLVLLVVALLTGFLGNPTGFLLGLMAVVGYIMMLSRQDALGATWWLWACSGPVVIVGLIVLRAGSGVGTWGAVLAALAWMIPVLTKPLMVSHVRHEVRKARAFPSHLMQKMGEFDTDSMPLRSPERALAHEMTSQALRALFAIPGVQMVHWLKSPVSMAGSLVGHAVILGSRVALIDTRVAPAGDYWWDAQGGLSPAGTHRGGFGGGDLFPSVVAAYQQTLSGMGNVTGVSGWIMVHPLGRGDLRTPDSGGPHGVMAGDPVKVVEGIGQWLLDGDPEKLNPYAMGDLWRLKHGRFDLPKDKRTHAETLLHIVSEVTGGNKSIRLRRERDPLTTRARQRAVPLR